MNFLFIEPIKNGSLLTEISATDFKIIIRSLKCHKDSEAKRILRLLNDIALRNALFQELL